MVGQIPADARDVYSEKTVCNLKLTTRYGHELCVEGGNETITKEIFIIDWIYRVQCTMYSVCVLPGC